MQILFLNGSPRNGNTKFALNLIAKGMQENLTAANIEIYEIAKHKISGCISCNGCKKNNDNCIMPDESADIINKIASSDYIIFGSPVYWWGITSQLKAVIDKMYSKDPLLHDYRKRIGIVIIGGSEIQDPQYRIILEQFQCICNYIGWDIVFSYSASAYEPDDISKNPEEISALQNLWQKFY